MPALGCQGIDRWYLETGPTLGTVESNGPGGLDYDHQLYSVTVGISGPVGSSASRSPRRQGDVPFLDSPPRSEQAPPDDTPPATGSWWANQKFLAWLERIVILVVGGGALYGGKKGVDVYRRKKAAS